MSGQEISEIDRKRINKKFICSSCDLLLVEPMQTLCGHLICKGCVENIFSQDSPSCPKDGVSLNEKKIFADAFTKREIAALELHCLNPECDWVGLPNDLQAHLNTCAYTMITCVHTQCRVKVKRLLLAEHLKHECLYRSVWYENCHEFLPFSSLETSKRKELCKHYKDASRFHIQLLLKFIFSLQGEIEKVTPQLQSFATKQMVDEEIRKVKDAIRTMEVRFSPMMATITGLTERPKSVDLSKASGSNAPGASAEIRRVEIKMTREMEELQAQKNRLEIQLRETTELLERWKIRVLNIAPSQCREDVESQTGPHSQQAISRFHSSLVVIQQFEEALQNLRDEIAPVCGTVSDVVGRLDLESPGHCTGTLLWKIDGYQRKRQDAINGVKTALYSPPFYTTEFGCKMCGKICMNGDGLGKGSHLSLFFVVMRGDYDALQTWPFQKKITMMLLDQGNGDHMIDAFHSDPQSSSFQRPKSDMNVASGSPLFMPLDSLNNRQYIKDDVMFIKIIVE